jgi:hypothetical protein
MRIAVLYMNNQFGLMAKVFLLSALISTLIKYLGFSLATSGGDAVLPEVAIVSQGGVNTIALIMVLSPTVIIAVLLMARVALFKRT